MSVWIVWLLVAFLNASFFDSLQKETESNAGADCSKLNTESLCLETLACIWDNDNSACSKDQCYERTLVPMDGCKTGITGYTCEKVKTVGESPQDGHFCLNQSRKGLVDTANKYCALEWGEFKAIEYAACQSLTGCGPLKEIAAYGVTYYTCQAGVAPTDPCTYLKEEVCPYVGMCMWEGGGCIKDPCWEQTMTNTDECRTGCTKTPLNPGGTIIYGYCKTGSHLLHSPCNVGTATNSVTKLGVCNWPNVPSGQNCNKVVTISKFDGDDYYVCNPEEKEFTVEGAAVSLRPFVAALTTLILLVMMM